MQFVIERDRYEDAVIALNDKLCKRKIETHSLLEEE